MERQFLQRGIKELVDECTDIDLLYLIKGLLLGGDYGISGN